MSLFELPVPAVGLSIPVARLHRLMTQPGPNRNPDGGQLRANNDLAAASAWLGEYEDSPRTHRSYRRELRRFLVWLYHARQQPLSGVTREDLQAYTAFLAAPAPEWCAQRYARRDETDWRLWEGPLNRQSIEHAVRVLTSLFGYLSDLGYLKGNPMGRARRTRTQASAPPPMQAPIRYLPAQLLQAIETCIEQAIQGTDRLALHRQYERWLFVLRFLANTGARRVELASARQSQIVEIPGTGGLQVWQILGKGQKWRQVVLSPAAVATLSRYHTEYGGPKATAPLVLSLSGRTRETGECLEESRIYGILREMLTWSAETLAGLLLPAEAEVLARASPHWLRRTYATACLEQGIALKHVLEQLGHGAMGTTLAYQTSELQERQRIFQALSL